MGNPFSYDNHDYFNFAKEVNLCTISSLHRYYDLLLVRKILYYSDFYRDNTLLLLFPYRDIKYNLRKHGNLIEANTIKNYIYYSTIFRLKRIWNLLDTKTKSYENMIEFKNALFDYCCKFG